MWMRCVPNACAQRASWFLEFRGLMHPKSLSSRHELQCQDATKWQTASSHVRAEQAQMTLNTTSKPAQAMQALVIMGTPCSLNGGCLANAVFSFDLALIIQNGTRPTARSAKAEHQRHRVPPVFRLDGTRRKAGSGQSEQLRHRVPFEFRKSGSPG